MTKYEFIKDRLKDLGKTQKELANYVNIAPPHLSAIIKGIREIQQKEIVSFAKFLDINLENFTKYISGVTKELDYENNNQITTISKIGFVQAGAWNEATQLPEDEWEEVYYPVNDNLKNKRIFALGVRGDSMNKIFPPEKTTLICCCIDDYDGKIENGDYIIAYRKSSDGLYEATVKRYMKTDNNTIVLVAESTNPTINNIILHPDDKEYDIAAVVIDYQIKMKEL
ncbi:MAG: LexA family protein [Alphaproteobacteria bacterium]